MSRVYGWRGKLVGTSLVLALAVMQGRAGGSETPAIDWDSPQMREIEAEWISLRDAHELARLGQDFPSRYIEFVASVDQLFRRRMSPRQLRDLAASSKVPAVPDNDRGFRNDLLAFMVKAFVQTGDREGLVELLSKRCPSLIDGPLSVEYHLASRGWKLRDPMLIFSEAYAKSQAPKTRHTLATTVRRSFAGLGIREKDDAEFVKKATQWYKKEKGRLIVNTNYPSNETAPGGITVSHSYERDPDFFDNPPPGRQPLFKVVPQGGPTNLGEEPDR
jgi:hypothetical protein